MATSPVQAEQQRDLAAPARSRARSAFRVTTSDDPDMEAVALAVAGQKRAELIAHHACVGPLLELGRAEEARQHIERARAIVRELEAWRFEPANLAFLAEVEVEAGRPDRARPLLAEGLLLTLLGTGIAGRQRLACRGR